MNATPVNFKALCIHFLCTKACSSKAAGRSSKTDLQIQDSRAPEGLALHAALKIQRMSGEPGQEFGQPDKYPYLCVASPSCHDTSTTRAWYEEDAARRQRFYTQANYLYGQKFGN